MKILLTPVLFLIFISTAQGQPLSHIDSLKQAVRDSPPDSNQLKLLLEINEYYFFSKPDSSLEYATRALTLARALKSTEGELESLRSSGEALRILGEYPSALKMQFEALAINRKEQDLQGEGRSLVFIGFTYVEFREYRQALSYQLQANRIFQKLPVKTPVVPFNLSNIGNAYDLLKMPDSALFYQKQALGSYSGMTHGPLKSLILLRLGNAYFSLDRKDSALVYYYKALQSVHTINDRVNNGRIERKIAELYASDSRYDSSLYYARRSFAHVTQSGQRLEILETSKLMFSLFRLQNNIDSAFFYQNYAQVMTDSLYGPQKFKQLQLLMMDEQQRQQVALQEKEGSTNRIKFAALFSALGFSLLFAFILIRNNNNKQKANNLLKEQKEKIEETLSVLKATQSQLIQSEKMASLGELTAGIAHEIQNPLNFVNNFSEVNSELMEEIVQEAVKGNLEEVKTIARDVKENEEKINFHGKRASDIVKGMLQHSRGSSGKKELTDINNLCDEYLRLSYHGYRAKDKSFSAKYATDFDTSLPKLSVVPQDIGRVVLNLINNAFYAVSEKTKLQAAGYEPQVVVTTKKDGDKILILVKDNGNGIPDSIKEKIFQPFFTTKPTGQGTGLGLSLSYDIVRAHGGELKVETSESEVTTFIIQLPV